MAESSSPLTSELEGKENMYQVKEKPGPRGAYEARQVNGGLYVRVDMPGVPPDGVKIFKRGEAHTVTFTGKAPILWSECESSGRVYGGYVVLDRNPDEIDVQMTVVNGSLRLFFPNSDGIPHFFPPKIRVPNYVRVAGSVLHVGDDKDCCHNKFVQYLNEHDATVPGFEGFKDMPLHPSGCSCCQETQNNDVPDAYLELRKMSSAHINPYLLDGKEGLVETMLLVDTNGERMYTRIDMPGLGAKNNSMSVEHGGASLFFGGEGSLEHPFDEGGRTYAAGLTFHCNCCKMVDVKQVMKDGVLRVLFRRHTAPGSSGMDCRIAFLVKS